jgi:hypothetical protein
MMGSLAQHYGVQDVKATVVRDHQVMREILASKEYTSPDTYRDDFGMMDMHENPRFVNELLDGPEALCCSVIDRLGRDDRVDAIGFSDEMGAQRSMLISPAMWRRFRLLTSQDFRNPTRAGILS